MSEPTTREERQLYDLLMQRNLAFPIGHGPGQCDPRAAEDYRFVLRLIADVERLEGLLRGLLLSVDAALQDLVLPLLRKAEAEKHDESKAPFERERQQGIADALRQVKIYLEDNESVAPIANARAALEEAP